MRRKFSEEFKGDAVKLVLRTGLSASRASKELGIGQSTLEKWVQQARQAEGKINPSGLAESEEIRRLKAENQKLRLERELLKKATVFFANDHSS